VLNEGRSLFSPPIPRFSPSFGLEGISLPNSRDFRKASPCALCARLFSSIIAADRQSWPGPTALFASCPFPFALRPKSLASRRFDRSEVLFFFHCIPSPASLLPLLFFALDPFFLLLDLKIQGDLCAAASYSSTAGKTSFSRFVFFSPLVPGNDFFSLPFPADLCSSKPSSALPPFDEIPPPT